MGGGGTGDVWWSVEEEQRKVIRGRNGVRCVSVFIFLSPMDPSLILPFLPLPLPPALPSFLPLFLLSLSSFPSLPTNLPVFFWVFLLPILPLSFSHSLSSLPSLPLCVCVCVSLWGVGSYRRCRPSPLSASCVVSTNIGSQVAVQKPLKCLCCPVEGEGKGVDDGAERGGKEGKERRTEE